MTNELTQERLKQCLSYDPETGVFVRLLPASNAVKAGAVAGSQDPVTGHLRISIDRRSHWAHRLAWLYVHGKWPEQYIDHINGNRADNRIINLRDVSKSVNAQNQRRAKAHNKSGFLGVSKSGRRWSAEIKAGARIKLGYFDTPEEAHAAYVAAKRKFHEGCSL